MEIKNQLKSIQEKSKSSSSTPDQVEQTCKSEKQNYLNLSELFAVSERLDRGFAAGWQKW